MKKSIKSGDTVTTPTVYERIVIKNRRSGRWLTVRAVTPKGLRVRDFRSDRREFIPVERLSNYVFA